LCGLLLIVEQLSEAAKMHALNQGADVVLTRPVSTGMIVAQANALGRRVQSVPNFVLPRLELEQLSLDPSVRTVTVGGSEPQRLTRLEFQLLYVLMTNRGHVVPAEVLVERVWGYSGEGDRDLVRGLVSRVRQKLQSGPNGTEFIETIPGVGYRFTSDEL
jgi:DNA-binding response OmpR family regulator